LFYCQLVLVCAMEWLPGNELFYEIILVWSNGNKSLGFSKRNLEVANTQIKSRAYQALVRPKLEHSCSVWDHHTNDQQDLFPFDVILSMCLLHLRFDCSVTPRYFADDTDSRL
jgi:hypothetical protein